MSSSSGPVTPTSTTNEDTAAEAVSSSTPKVDAVNPLAAETVVPVSKITSIEVRFTKVIRDINKHIIPYGTATATYGNGTTLSVAVTGGCNVSPYGITDPVKKLPIFRVENSLYKNHNGDAMPYALFYHGGEALHVGRIDKTSHGCVHVGDAAKMKKLNQDAVKNKTTVSVVYDPGILDKVMKRHL